MATGKGRARSHASIDPAAFARRWHTFLQLRVLALHPQMGITHPGLVSFAIPALPELVASLLYVDLASLVEAAMKSQMSRTKFSDLEDLEHRIDYLAEEGKILDREALQALRRRRNEIAHKVERVTEAELKAAIDLVQRQLEAWGVVGAAPPYEFFADRGGAQASDRAGYGSRRDLSVGVTREGKKVLEYTWSEYLAND